MITPTCSASFADRWFRPATLPLGACLALRFEASARPRPAPAPRPRRLAASLEQCFSDGAPVALNAQAAAARAFTAGDGFLPGQMIDRAI